MREVHLLDAMPEGSIFYVMWEDDVGYPRCALQQVRDDYKSQAIWNSIRGRVVGSRVNYTAAATWVDTARLFVLTETEQAAVQCLTEMRPDASKEEIEAVLASVREADSAAA